MSSALVPAGPGHGAVPPPPPPKPAPRRWLRPVAWTVTTVLLTAAAVFIVVMTWPRGAEESDWREPQALPAAKPAWSKQTGATAFIHDNLLVQGSGNGRGSRLDVTVSDLATGEEVTSLDGKVQSAWPSGDLLVTRRTDTEFAVHELRGGKEQRTVKFDDAYAATVVSGMLIGVEATDASKPRLKAVDIATGKEKWSEKLDRSPSGWRLLAPYDQTSRQDSSEFLIPESVSPFVMVGRQAGDTFGWGAARAVNVKTGETRWSDPIADFDFDDPVYPDYDVTASGDLHVIARERSAAPEGDRTSVVIDAESGAAATYPLPPWVKGSGLHDALEGDVLATVEAGYPALVDTATGKTVWKAEDDKSPIANGGAFVMTSVTDDWVTSGEDQVFGTRATELGSNDALWTKRSKPTVNAFVAGDYVLTPAYTSDSVTQIVDKRTGEGRWQIHAARLVEHNEDYALFRSGPESNPTILVMPWDARE